MNAELKAAALIEKFSHHIDSDMYEADGADYAAIQCALICVDEIIEALKTTTGHCELRSLDWHEVQSDFKYWDTVRKHLLTK